MARLVIDSPFSLPMTKAEEYWEEKVNVSPEVYKEMTAEEKVQSFAVASIAKGDELDTVQRAIQRAIKEGTTLEQFKKDAAEVFSRRGWDTEKPYRIDNIFRTNMQGALSAGNWAEINTGNLFPFVSYSSINDGRITPICKRLSGLTFRREDPALNTIAPTNHFQ
ncbi:MAG: hypothetical protein JRE40_09015 [Deltaproteobacteria bacterium]|nr:hypothetical protein [Deltaproteobacteria bacterium]MBW2688320.1 hypothetical protein [Deltaproteobacteria bacterium]